MISQLAIDGGSPEFPTPIHVGRPNIFNQDKFLADVATILNNRWLSNDGPYVKNFEAALASQCQAKHVIVFCNATIALETLVRALDLKGEVLVPSFTFVATAHSVFNSGLKPVFCDIDPASHCLSPAAVAAAITPETTCIMATHVWGNLCDVQALEKIAREHSLKLIFDAAHAFNCSLNGKPCGNFGDAEVFSFHATKFLNSFEGGAIATNDDALAAKLRLMRNFGFSGIDRVECAGTNGKMCEVSAAMGLANLAAVGQIVAVNQQNYEAYRSNLADSPAYNLFGFSPGVTPNYQYVVVHVDEKKAGISRDKIVECLWKENVLARKYFWPCCHNMPPYRDMPETRRNPLTATQQVADSIIVLPTGCSVGLAEIGRICALLKTMTRNG